MIPIRFRASVVASKPNGDVVIACFSGLPPPLGGLDTCVALLECDRATFDALCASSPDNVAISDG